MTTSHATANPAALARERARALARAIGESAVFRAFEAAEEALDANAELRSRIAAVQAREQELRMSQAWGGVSPDELKALEREWEDLATHPVFAAHLAARQDLVGLLREVAGVISEGVGLDFGSACAPAGGCC
jgi:cell fate (sporulation/competence/biofilm development) regulator YlbF (YheA/YmcA/DUF963 family)